MKSKVKTKKDEIKDNDYYTSESLKPIERRIFQMEDDCGLEGRLQIIEYLIMKKNFSLRAHSLQSSVGNVVCSVGFSRKSSSKWKQSHLNYNHL